MCAWHGCLPCLKHCIEVHGVDAKVESDTMKYTAMHWARWAVQNDVPGGKEVYKYMLTNPKKT